MSRLALVLTFALALAAVVVADHYVYTIEQVYYTGTVNCDNTPQSNSSYPNGTCALLINGGGSTNVSCDANGYPSGWACPGNTPTCAASEGTTCGFIDGGEGQVWGTSHCLGGFGTSLSITCIETLTPGAPPTAPTAPTEEPAAPTAPSATPTAPTTVPHTSEPSSTPSAASSVIASAAFIFTAVAAVSLF